ncbi:hypothetical protein Acy02nite_34960 [Actinoplanes cyaneus]|uniref:Novel STAND NTPase 1 domain-containing protein n=1 Tax=Actinoplanes cyaneus TaxID=52696 RepID=A0A919M0Y1_9ACTN|nr:trypsin-like peptidase domain-containing protein [Actinoplanes cyaneus]MCW2140297.1 WD40 repeat [Actinoplanes cyaneus]GID65615.1 hypothetical protein Acy02nite_34960 [Actinoplanes cyaneus]
MPELAVPVATPLAGGLEPAIVRVRGEDGSAVGAGFLVAGRTVLTCAHVVQRAGRARVEFPLLPGSSTLDAEITALLPALADGTGDIAVLTLAEDPPPAARPARMAVEDELWGHPCRLFGFSGGREDGVWAAGILRGRQAIGWVQLESSGTTGYTVEPGFSGAPVWDDELAAVVGMAVAAEVDGDLRAAYMIPTALLTRAWTSLSDITRPPCPYRGLAAFREQDAAVFFGREDRTAQLVQEIGRRSFVAVVGPSGTGKSSLVFSGLLPVVHQRPDWVTATMRAARASSGVAALAAALLPLLEPDQTETERLAALARLTGVLRDGHLRDVVDRILTRAGARRLLLIVDQFEEVFGSADAAEITGIVLSGLGEGGVTAVITLRADFLGQALQLPALAEALGESVTAVGEMDRHRLRQVIEEPLPACMAYEPGLVDRILDDVGDEAGRLPLLEFALTLLWERQENGRLTHAAYHELGGVKGALARYAEQVYQEQVEPADREPFRRLLTQLVRPGESGEPVRRVARRAELGERRWQLGQRLAATRLVTAGRDALGSETLELVHEALIDGWSRLRQWADEDHAFRAWQEDVRKDVLEWQKLDRDVGTLLRGMPLAEAVRWLGERDDDIGDAERRYIVASKVYQGRSVRRLRAIVAALTVLGLVAAGLGVIALEQGRDKARQANKSQARYLVGQAEEISGSADTRKDLGLLLAAAAYRFFPNDETTGNLTFAASRYRFVSHLLPVEASAGAIVFSPSDPHLLAVSGANRIELWDVERRTLVHAVPVVGYAYGGSAMDFAPAGDVVAFAETGQRETRVKLWRHATGDLVLLPTGKKLTESVSELRFSPDGRRLVACTENGYLSWSVDRLAKGVTIPRPAAEQGCQFAWNSDSATITVADGTDLVTWDVSTGQRQNLVKVSLPADELRMFGLDRKETITGLAGTRDGRVAAVQSRGGMVWWDLERRAPRPGFSPERSVGELPVFSADNRWAFFESGAVVRLSDRARVRTVPTDSSSSGKTVALSGDGSTVAFVQDGPVQIVHLGDFDPVPVPESQPSLGLWADGRHVTLLERPVATTVTLDPPRSEVSTRIEISRDPADPQDMALSDGAGMIAGVDPAHQVRLWNTETRPTTSRAFPGPWRRLRTVMSDHAGTSLVAIEESRAYVVNTATGAIVPVPFGDGFFPAELALGPGGRYLFAGDADSHRSVLWDTSSGTATAVPLPYSAGNPVFSPDGRWLGLTTGNDVVVRDLTTGTEFRRFHSIGVAAFDRQGARIALEMQTTDQRGVAIEVRDLGSGHLIHKIYRLNSSPVMFTADGARVIVADGGVLADHLLGAEVALRRVCELVGRDLTRDEWQTYASGFPYRRICP